MNLSPPAAGRRVWLDWMRGLAVLIMIEAHVLDSWTRAADRDGAAFGWAIILGGMGAPLFLFLAGVAIPLSAGSKLRRTGDRATAARLVMRRGLEIFLLAFLFRLQAWLLGWAPPETLLRVDILNIMGPSIAGTAFLWSLAATPSRRAAVFAAATATVAFATPFVRSWSALDALPDPLEAYLRPAGGFAMFVLFPWAAFVPAGALLGNWLDTVRSREAEARLTRHAAAAGLALALTAFALSYLASPFAGSSFWTSSPAFFFLRVGLLLALAAPAYAWASRSRPGLRSPIAQLGRTSLFIYWIHVELVYGFVSRPLRGALSLGEAGLAWALFACLMFACSLGKERAVSWWSARRATGLVSTVSASAGRG
jgi:uncharacterized membrane protein